MGSPVTFVCRSFLKLSPEDASATVLHEALHFAGLEERPPVSTARTAREITLEVQASCFRNQARDGRPAGQSATGSIHIDPDG